MMTRKPSEELDLPKAGAHVVTVFTRIACILLVTAFAAVASVEEPEKSVVQIINFSQQPVWDAPWRFDAVRKGSGSGFVIRGNRIMTNAHVVSWARQIHVRRHQDPRLYLARVEFIGHDCDLAILTVEDPDFFEGLEPLSIGEFPKVRSTVVTYGYPAGGEQISYTRGVVSRIELQTYAHIGNRAYLGVQTDAAINPGNSGGPVIQDGKVVGVAFQGISSLENTGFFIPPPVIDHFIQDVEDGVYDGFPQAGIRIRPLQNDAYRRMLKLPNNGLGARIDSMLPVPTTREVLREDDVLLRVGEYDVASDATVLFDGNRLSVAIAFQTVQHGESVPVKVWRDGAELDLMLPLYVYNDDKATGNQYDIPPRYFVFAGLVFTPLSLDYLRSSGRGWTDESGADLIYEMYHRPHESPDMTRTEPIVLASTLAAPVNANLAVERRVLVDKVNGVRIDKLEDLIEAIESADSRFHVIEFANKTIEVLDRVEAESAHPEILKTYSIPQDRRL